MMIFKNTFNSLDHNHYTQKLWKSLLNRA